MSRKKLIMFVVLPLAAVLSLGGGFLMAYLFSPEPAPEPNQVAVEIAAEKTPELGLPTPRSASPEVDAQRRATQNKLTQELNDLMRDMNAKRREYEDKIRGLQKEEERMAKVREAAKEDLQRLDELRIDVANTFAKLKKEKQDLEDAKIRVKKDENANLKVMAKVLGKMEPENAADMISTMSERPAGPDPALRPGLDEAALYLFLMEEKLRPEIFNALVSTGKSTLAAALSRKMKFIELEK